MIKLPTSIEFLQGTGEHQAPVRLVGSLIQIHGAYLNPVGQDVPQNSEFSGFYILCTILYLQKIPWQIHNPTHYDFVSKTHED